MEARRCPLRMAIWPSADPKHSQPPAIARALVAQDDDSIARRVRWTEPVMIRFTLQQPSIFITDGASPRTPTTVSGQAEHMTS